MFILILRNKHVLSRTVCHDHLREYGHRLGPLHSILAKINSYIQEECCFALFIFSNHSEFTGHGVLQLVFNFFGQFNDNQLGPCLYFESFVFEKSRKERTKTTPELIRTHSFSLVISTISIILSAH